MNKAFRTLALTAFLLSPFQFASAENLPPNSKHQLGAASKMSGSSTTDDHMKAMMAECMKMNKDEKICQPIMQKCQQDMKAAECEKIHQSMKKAK